MARRITVTVEKDLTPEAYADLAHALWAVAFAVHQDHVSVVADTGDKAAMNARWRELGRSVPWQ